MAKTQEKTDSVATIKASQDETSAACAEICIEAAKAGHRSIMEWRPEMVRNLFGFSWTETANVFDESLGTGWFSGITADVAHNKLIEGYNFSSRLWRKIVTLSNASDYRDQNATAFGGFDALPEKKEHEAFTSLNPVDRRETFPIYRRGGLFEITDEARAADQIGAFARWTREAGSAAGRAVEKELVGGTYGISSNSGLGPTMSDSVALFNAAHSNTAATKGAFSLANLKEMAVLMLDQTGEGSEKLQILPRYILCESGNYIVGLETVTTTLGGAGGTSTVRMPDPNIFGSQGPLPMEVLYSPYCLDGHYYLLADPATGPLMELAFVNGRQEPEFLQENAATGLSFSSGITRFRVSISFGVFPADWRTMVHYAEA